MFIIKLLKFQLMLFSVTSFAVPVKKKYQLFSLVLGNIRESKKPYFAGINFRE